MCPRAQARRSGQGVTQCPCGTGRAFEGQWRDRVAGGDSRAQRTRTTSRCTVGALRGALSTGDRPGRLSSGQPVTSLVTGADPRAPTPPSTCPLCRSVSCAVVLLFPQPGLSSRPWLCGVAGAVRGPVCLTFTLMESVQWPSQVLPPCPPLLTLALGGRRTRLHTDSSLGWTGVPRGEKPGCPSKCTGQQVQPRRPPTVPWEPHGLSGPPSLLSWGAGVSTCAHRTSCDSGAH